jgi:hypothetical protein
MRPVSPGGRQRGVGTRTRALSDATVAPAAAVAAALTYSGANRRSP